MRSQEKCAFLGAGAFAHIAVGRAESHRVCRVVGLPIATRLLGRGHFTAKVPLRFIIGRHGSVCGRLEDKGGRMPFSGELAFN